MNYMMIGFGVLLASFAHMIIGMLWYSPTVFGTMWMQLARVTPDPSRMKNAIICGFISNIIMASIMVCFMIRLNITTFAQAFNFGWMAWLGFVAPTSLQSVLWANDPVQLYVLNNGCRLASMVVMALILVHFI